ncbi:MAG: FKBP-type peptidyl-prolyl cis-trans isomerase [Treponema sp.]|nr:FKBP-type peptidyl-prolyl cis-trans isomerase [Treponema sp.]
MSSNRYLIRGVLVVVCLALITGIFFGARAIVINIKKSSDLAKVVKEYPNAIVTPSGLRYIVLEEGTGPKPIAGRPVRVNYIGTLLNGKEFENTYTQGSPLEFNAGSNQAIKGFDEAVMDMREGEKRLVIIPPELGYGSQSKGAVPANSFIIFELQLYRVR